MPKITWFLGNPALRFILILSSFSVLACNRSFRPTINTGFEGKPLPAFDILLADSNTVLNTAALPKGSPLVMMFFSPNCPYSQAEMSNIISNISTLKSTQFCIFTNWPFNQLKGFYSYYQLYKYANIIVGQDFKNYFTSHYKPVGVPFTMIYSKDRRLINAFVGTMPGDQIKEISVNN